MVFFFFLLLHPLLLLLLLSLFSSLSLPLATIGVIGYGKFVRYREIRRNAAAGHIESVSLYFSLKIEHRVIVSRDGRKKDRYFSPKLSVVQRRIGEYKFKFLAIDYLFAAINDSIGQLKWNSNDGRSIVFANCHWDRIMSNAGHVKKRVINSRGVWANSNQSVQILESISRHPAHNAAR